MSMEDFYNHMKEALKYFDLRFSEMHLVKVTLEEKRIVFKYKQRMVGIELN